MERFDGTPEEKKAVMGLLAEMGYAVEGGGIPQLQKDVQELSPEAFMEAIPKGTDFRTRANLSRFVKDLMLGETDPPPVGLSDPVDTIAEKDSAKDLSVVKGSMLLFHSYMYRSMAAFAATLRPPLAPVQPTACVYL